MAGCIEILGGLGVLDSLLAGLQEQGSCFEANNLILSERESLDTLTKGFVLQGSFPYLALLANSYEGFAIRGPEP